MTQQEKIIWQAIKIGCEYGKNFPEFADEIIEANQKTLIEKAINESKKSD